MNCALLDRKKALILHPQLLKDKSINKLRFI